MKKLYDKRSLTIRIVVSILIVCMGILSFVFRGEIENSLSGGKLYALEEASMKIFFVDVGQGDAIFIEFPDKTNLLIDCGSEKNAPSLVEFLNERGVKKINYFVYTHADEDHIGGGKLIFDTYEIETLYRPKLLCETERKVGNPNNYNVKDTKTYENSILSAYQEDGCEMKFSSKGEEIIGDEYRIVFLNPDQDNYSDSNDYSAVLMVECNGIKALFQADADAKTEEKLLLTYGEYLKADILKVSHHGSATGTSESFLKMVAPDYAIISSGQNIWGLPDIEIIERLERADLCAFDTCEDGSICFGIDEYGEVTVYTTSSIKRLDSPLVVSLVFLGLILTWGIIFPKKKEKI